MEKNNINWLFLLMFTNSYHSTSLLEFDEGDTQDKVHKNNRQLPVEQRNASMLILCLL